MVWEAREKGAGDGSAKRAGSGKITKGGYVTTVPNSSQSKKR